MKNRSTSMAVCGVAAAVFATITAQAREIHVEMSGDDLTATGTEASPFASIQAAIDASSNGDTIIVGDGSFAPFAVNRYDLVIDYIWAREQYGYSGEEEDRIAMDEAFNAASARELTLRSRNGADFTFVDGGGTTTCVVLSSSTNTVLSGFTILNGYNDTDGAGGVIGGLSEDCVISANSSANSSGGAYGGHFRRCLFAGNSGNQGGGAARAILEDCLLYGNSASVGWASIGGAAFYSELKSCTVVGNESYRGEAVCGGSLENCIVWGNTSLQAGGFLDLESAVYSCLEFEFAGEGNISADPQFFDAGDYDFRLKSSSPCIDAGSAALSSSTADLGGLPRIYGSSIDMGCHESNPLPFSASDFDLGLHLWLGLPIRPQITMPGTPPFPASNVEVSYSDNAAPGTAFAILSGTGGYVGSVSVPFEICDLFGIDEYGLVPTNAAECAWDAVEDATAPGGLAARGRVAGSNASSSVVLGAEGPGVLAFSWRVSCNPRGQGLALSVDGIRHSAISGATEWATVSIPLGGGRHTFEWSYYKGSTSAMGEDAGYVADVSWSPAEALAITLDEALDAAGLSWTTAAGAEGWAAQAIVTADGADAARAGSVLGDAASALSTIVEGAGEFSFSVRLDISGSAGLDLFVDGALARSWASTRDWTRESVSIAAIGEHAISFEFWNAGTAETASDAAFLDMAEWTPIPEVTAGSPVPVPYSWLLGQGAVPPGATLVSDFESAAVAQAANGENKVWECYVAGISPTNPASFFLAEITMEPDGSPRVSWRPDLRPDRVYTVLGREGLSGEWAPANLSHRFFKVKVEMP